MFSHSFGKKPRETWGLQPTFSWSETGGNIFTTPRREKLGSLLPHCLPAALEGSRVLCCGARLYRGSSLSLFAVSIFTSIYGWEDPSVLQQQHCNKSIRPSHCSSVSFCTWAVKYPSKPMGFVGGNMR